MSLDKFIDALAGWPKKLSAKLRPSNELDQRVERYADLQGTSTKKLNFGLWYVQHTKIFFLVLVWSLVIVAAVLWSFSLYLLADYLFVGLKHDRETLAQLSQPIDVVRYNYDVNLEILEAEALPIGSNHYDLVGSLKNDNANVWGSFSYYFLADGKQLAGGAGFILPNEEKFLLSLNQEMSWRPQKVVLVLDYFSWRRLDAHKIPDWEQYKSDRLNFVVRDKVFTTANESGLTENVEVNLLSFNVTNQSIFNYKQVPFLVILYSGQEIVGVNRYTFANFQSGQKEAINLTIVGRLPNITSMVVVPDVNILEAGNFGQIN